jgi:hypothetical protein
MGRCVVPEPLVFPFFLLRDVRGEVPRSHDARVGRVDALSFTGQVWSAGPSGGFGVLVHWCGLRAHPLPDALDEAEEIKKTPANIQNNRRSGSGTYRVVTDRERFLMTLSWG